MVPSAGDLGTFSQTISYGAFDFDFAVDLLEYIMAKCWTQVRHTHSQAGRHTHVLHMAAGSWEARQGRPSGHAPCCLPGVSPSCLLGGVGVVMVCVSTPVSVCVPGRR